MVRGDYLPEQMTDGERAAITSSSANGWITPPLYNSLKPEGERPWRTVHCRYLERRGLIAKSEQRQDGLFRYRLNQTGWQIKQQIESEAFQNGISSGIPYWAEMVTA